MSFFHRTLLLSLLLHGAAIFFSMNYAYISTKHKPIFIDLTFIRLSEGLTGDLVKKPSSRGNNAPLIVKKQRVPEKTAPQAATNRVQAYPKEVVQKTRAERMAAQPVNSDPAQQVERERKSPSTENRSPSGRQAASKTSSANSTGSESAISAQPGDGARAHGKSGDSGDAGGLGTLAGNSPKQLQSKYLSENFAYIKDIIQKRLTYPGKARREGMEGEARVSFVILENGQVSDIRIISSTGYAILDSNVIETIREVAPFPKPPVKAELRMPIFYRLE
jgi:protein TonB